MRYRPKDEAALLSKFSNVDGEGKVSIVIWTTPPWTLPASQAVSIHPEFKYVLVEMDIGTGKERLIVAEEIAAKNQETRLYMKKHEEELIQKYTDTVRFKMTSAGTFC